MDFSILLDNVRPIGQGFLPKEKCTPLSEKASTSPLHKEMDAYRTEIQSKILNMLGSEAAHDESKFICKAALIAECSTHSPSVLDKRGVLIPLLCDQDVLCSLQYQDYASTHGEYLAERKAYLEEGKHPTLYDDTPSEMRDVYRFLSKALHKKAIERARAGGTSSTTVASAIGNIQSEVTFAYAEDDAPPQTYKSAIADILGEDDPAALQYLASMSEEDCRFFAEVIFRRYVSFIRAAEMIKDANAHFRQKYYMWQYDHLKDSKHLRAQIDELWALAEKPYQAGLERTLASIARRLMGEAKEYLLTTEDEDYAYDSDSIAALLQTSVNEYTHVMSGRRVDVPYSYISAMLDECDIYANPFLALCILADVRYGGRLPTEITADTLLPVLSKFHKATAAQRIAAIRFLKNIMQVLTVDDTHCREAWTYLSITLGRSIASQEEATEWEYVLATNFIAGDDLPLIRLNMLLWSATDKCLTIQKERLYSYHRGSVLQRGGYARFLQDHSDAVDEIVRRITQNRQTWNISLLTYQKMWASPYTNKSSVEGLCEKSASLIRWSSVNRKYDIPAFCKGIIKKGRDYEPTLLELKSLLTEHAMRQVLNDDARQTLKTAISTILNRCF